MKEKFFHLCKKLSQHSDHHQHKLGAVIVKKNKILGIGFNKVKTHTKSPHKFNMLHAEISAILNTDPKDLEGSSIYVYRERKDGKLGNARPCIYCYQLIYKYKIKKIYYSSEDGFMKEYVA